MTPSSDVPSGPESCPAPGATLGERAAHALLEYRAGRPAALDALIREASRLLWATARSQGASYDDAADIVQNTWMQLVRNADRIDEPRAVLKWLLTTVRRAAWDAVRKDRAEARVRTVMSDDDVAGRASAVPDPAPQPDAEVLADERDRLLWQAFGTLPERCQQLLHLVSLADRPDYRMISEAIGMPVGSIGATRGRCLAKLRTEFVRSGGGAWT
ncbi:sigma-70 family RNA polymerase sigma factor [Myceligenerans crystallogenes]|uniref:Sigma-70 family RNA polymerase sigma factor n=1 Tax=Myceligenerans crystallogenes TaxID=316335 RepID=A0ABN2N4R1_9MICO